jgi:Macrocin-O-methyltransferase (TylF)
MTGWDTWRHLRNPTWVASQAYELGARVWCAVAPTPFAQLYRTVRPHTMCSASRLRGLYDAVSHVIADDVPGDVVECGVARGGSAALMGLAMSRMGSASRRLWVFDTFEGLPPPTDEDPDWAIAEWYTGRCRGELHEVEALFAELGILERSSLVKGLFQQTLPMCSIPSIAVLHVDGDWYESVRVCLEHLYERVSPGGVIQIDDYGHWAGARKAVDEFLRSRSINTTLRRLDYTGRQLIKQ